MKSKKDHLKMSLFLKIIKIKIQKKEESVFFGIRLEKDTEQCHWITNLGLISAKCQLFLI